MLILRTNRIPLVLLLPVLVLLCVLTASVAQADEGSRERAQMIADQVMQALGGFEAWENTRLVSWKFMGRRDHVWDRTTGDVRIESDETVVLMNLRDRSGRVFRGGEEVTDPAELEKALEQGYAWWVNDSYWVFMPYKLQDEGVSLDHLGSRTMENGREGQVLELTFEGVGLTPQNRYEVVVDDETHLVREWSYFADASDEEPAFTGPWDDWKQVGDIWLAGSRGRGFDWELAVYSELPRSVFEDPAPAQLD